MSAIITSGFRLLQAESFKDTFNTSSMYLAIAKSSPWTNELIPDTPADSYTQETLDFKELLAMKRINGTDASYAIPWNSWTGSKVYKQYDDQDGTMFTDLVNPMVVINATFQVYKCVYNNGGVNSTVAPSGELTSIITTAEGYRWKYMFTVSPANLLKFYSTNWIPVTKLLSSDGSTQWNVQTAAVSGKLDNILVTSGGSGYTPNSSSIVVTITGDGTGATALATTNGSGVITSVTVTAGGSGYTFANASAGGSAVLRVVLPPKGGHGKSAVEELGAFYIMINTILAYSENVDPTLGDFTVKNDYRKILLVKNPIERASGVTALASTYDETTWIGYSTTSGTFIADELVTQATSGATGKVVEIDTVNKKLRLCQTQGTFTAGPTITGNTSSATISTTVAPVLPEVIIGTGAIVYKDYRRAVNRASDQREVITVIIEL